MKSCFLDTNVFIRYLTNDDPTKADKVDKLLSDAAVGEISLLTTEMVMAETVWVLESCYGLKAPEIAPLIRGIIATPGLDTINGMLVLRALELYESLGIDFIDGYIAAVMEKRGISDLYSYDRKHVSRLKSIVRKEP